MHIARPTAPQWAGLVMVWLGGIAAIRWLFRLDALAKVIPGFAEMGIVAPSLLLAAGVASVCLGGKRGAVPSRLLGRLVTGCIGLLLFFPVAMLAEHLTGVRLGVDIVREGVVPTLVNPFPGRMSPNACVAFLCAGAVLWMLRLPPSTVLRRLALGLVAVTATIGVVGCLGYFLRLEALYRLSAANRLTLPVAYGLVILGATLWLLRERWALPAALSFDRHEARITQRSVAIVAMVAVAAGASGFAVIQESFERARSDSLLLTATTSAEALANALEVGLWFPRTVATRPAVTQTLARLEQQPGDPAARELLQKVGESFLTAGVSRVRFFDARGALLATAGALATPGDVATLALAAPNLGAQLLWSDGYILRDDEPVIERGRRVGRVVTEQRLTIFDRLLSDIRNAGTSSDALICGRAAETALCAPARFHASAFSRPLHGADGKPDWPASRAVSGQSGTRLSRDASGVPVLAAYAPLRGFGLGMVVNTRADSLFATVRERLNLLAVLLAGLVGTAVVLLRSQVRPLVTQVVREQRRMQTILENSNDAFIALGADGSVTDWNSQAHRTFGWTPAEAIGRDLAELIIPPEDRPAHHAGMARFQQSGTGPIVGKRVELTALHRDGRRFPVELAVASFPTSDGHIAHAFARDITDRKAAEAAQLQTSENRLQTITDNLPALIAYIDQAHTMTLANKTFKDWLGIDPVGAIGRPLDEVMGQRAYLQRLPHLRSSLQGERVEFEVDATYLGVTRYLQITYVPDVRPDGTVAGVYGLSTDVTAIRLAEMRLDRIARIDALTGLPNRREFELRLEQAMARCRRSREPMALVFLDIDHFKRINDTHGHGVGDGVLREFASRLQHSVRTTDTAARLAGDEFVVILERLGALDDANAVALKLGEQIRQPLHLEGLTLEVTASMGLAFFEGSGGTVEDFLARADRELYRAKSAGRDTFAVTTF